MRGGIYGKGMSYCCMLKVRHWRNTARRWLPLLTLQSTWQLLTYHGVYSLWSEISFASRL